MNYGYYNGEPLIAPLSEIHAAQARVAEKRTKRKELMQMGYSKEDARKMVQSLYKTIQS